MNDVLITDGTSRCITGVTRNPSLAKSVSVPLSVLPDTLVLDGTTDVLKIKLSTRLGSSSADKLCGGHGSATGLRLYFDSGNRPSQLDATPEGSEDPA